MHFSKDLINLSLDLRKAFDTVHCCKDDVNKFFNKQRKKYISLWKDGAIEAYCEYRRTRYPTLNNPIPPPERLPYSKDEEVNNKNTPDIDVNKDKLWWAK